VTLAGRTAVVTGASSGIGEATARLLASEECNVVLAARRKERLNALAAELGEGTLAAPTDVTDPGACAALVARTVERFGSLDILVNNAGLGLYGSIPEGDPDDWRKMFDVNVLGVLYLTRAAVRHMLARGTGDVVFVSSLAGRRVPAPDGTVYAATKHAITAVAEGLVRTEFPRSSYPDAEEYYAQKGFAPLDPEDIAAAVLYAVSQPARVSVNEVAVRPTGQRR
jgi:NADP-dependent 3-hydroxy acid dehydrogenase YdfG